MTENWEGGLPPALEVEEEAGDILLKHRGGVYIETDSYTRPNLNRQYGRFSVGGWIDTVTLQFLVQTNRTKAALHATDELLNRAGREIISWMEATMFDNVYIMTDYSPNLMHRELRAAYRNQRLVQGRLQGAVRLHSYRPGPQQPPDLFIYRKGLPSWHDIDDNLNFRVGHEEGGRFSRVHWHPTFTIRTTGWFTASNFELTRLLRMCPFLRQEFGDTIDSWFCSISSIKGGMMTKLYGAKAGLDANGVPYERSYEEAIAHNAQTRQLMRQEDRREPPQRRPPPPAGEEEEDEYPAPPVGGDLAEEVAVWVAAPPRLPVGPPVLPARVKTVNRPPLKAPPPPPLRPKQTLTGDFDLRNVVRPSRPAPKAKAVPKAKAPPKGVVLPQRLRPRRPKK